MDTAKPATVIKKYANRRLYHTGTSAYVTLDDLAAMVRRGEDFVVQDAKTGEDITRGVLGQIIFDAEAKGGGLLPISFLRQLITFYDGQMQTLVPAYLEQSLAALAREQERLAKDMNRAIGQGSWEAMEKQVKANADIFRRSMRMFMPFASAPEDDASKPASAPDPIAEDVKALRAELVEMQAKITAMSNAAPTPAPAAPPSAEGPEEDDDDGFIVEPVRRGEV